MAFYRGARNILPPCSADVDLSVRRIIRDGLGPGLTQLIDVSHPP